MSLHSLCIGGVATTPNLILAPMSGVTNSAFRRLIKRENPNAVGLVVTEFISIEGMTRQNEQSLRMMRFSEEERPISIQIFGHTVERMVEAARMVEASGADIVDINSGCPVPKVVRRGGGCELMRQPEHLAAMLTAVRNAVKIPVTLKIRSGWDESSKNALEIARMAQECGIAMLAVHGRTRQALYRGEADWSIVEHIAAELSIPVVGSGDIVSRQSAAGALSRKVAGLMIGRAALHNPWIFSEIRAGLLGEEYVAPAELETVAVLERYLGLLLEDLPERAIIGKMKQFASQVSRRVHGSTPVRKALCTASGINEFYAILNEWRDFLAAKPSQHDNRCAERERTSYNVDPLAA